MYLPHLQSTLKAKESKLTTFSIKRLFVKQA
jgi:hypothetical protein